MYNFSLMPSLSVHQLIFWEERLSVSNVDKCIFTGQSLLQNIGTGSVLTMPVYLMTEDGGGKLLIVYNQIKAKCHFQISPSATWYLEATYLNKGICEL